MCSVINEMLTIRFYFIFCIFLVILIPERSSFFDIRNGEVVINNLADPLIEEFSRILVERGNNVVVIPDFHKNSTVGLFGKKKTVMRFEAKNNRMVDLSTLYRIGDVTLVQSDGLVVSFKLGLRVLECTSDYSLKIPLLRFTGRLLISVDESRIAFKAVVYKIKNRCTFDIQSLKIEELEGLKVTLTGFSILNKIVGKIVSWVLEKMEKSIEKFAEGELTKAIESAIESTKMCYKYE